MNSFFFFLWFLLYLLKVWEKMRESGEDDDKGMVSDIEAVWNLGGKEMSRSIKDGIGLFGGGGGGGGGGIDSSAGGDGR